jgi:hypothetical protein
MPDSKRGRGRPRLPVSMVKQASGIRLSADLYARIADRAASVGVPVAFVMRWAVDYYAASGMPVPGPEKIARHGSGPTAAPASKK